jgi:hypothetical protein
MRAILTARRSASAIDADGEQYRDARLDHRRGTAELLLTISVFLDQAAQRPVLGPLRVDEVAAKNLWRRLMAHDHRRRPPLFGI